MFIHDFNQRKRGTLAIFKNNIQPQWEDESNKNGYIIKFKFTRNL